MFVALGLVKYQCILIYLLELLSFQEIVMKVNFSNIVNWK